MTETENTQTEQGCLYCAKSGKCYGACTNIASIESGHQVGPDVWASTDAKGKPRFETTFVAKPLSNFGQGHAPPHNEGEQVLVHRH